MHRHSPIIRMCNEREMGVLKIIYPQESPAVFASEDYKQFFEANKEWLVPYAAFSYLRDLNETSLHFW